MRATTLADLECKLRPILTKLPPSFVTWLYSTGRKHFLKQLANEIVDGRAYTPPKNMSRNLWGLDFQSPLMNAAGMFKNGECIDMTFMQGAGGYLGGTGTWNPRTGNKNGKVHLPFTPYPNSYAASNSLGLPNNGDKNNAAKLSSVRNKLLPIGWSVMASPDISEDEKLEYLVRSMNAYEIAGVDWIEINESCPNTGHARLQDGGLALRLEYIKDNFVVRLKRRLPIVVKFSNDTNIKKVPELMDLLFENGFDGVNFGNTSKNYEMARNKIHPSDLKLFDYFTKRFEGGVSGKPLKEASLELATCAVEYLRAGPPTQEFHIVRTGGIDSLDDVMQSERAGISMNQWFTGYFEQFAKHGHGVYRELFRVAA
ncbi:MAG: hypothetical protein AABW71_04080 [Nanoarchaeota archaeon]